MYHPRVNLLAVLGIYAAFAFAGAVGPLQAKPPIEAVTYDQIKTFELDGGLAEVSDLRLKRDRVEMTFNGTFYFTAPIAGRVTGAVFIGRGTFNALPPESNFEKDNLRRLLRSEAISNEFTSAAFRFTDDTFDAIGANRREGPATPQAQRLAAEMNDKLLRETGANVAARTAISLLNKETEGIFIGIYEGGRPSRYSYVFDPQSRILTSNFTINGGEKGLIFTYNSAIRFNDVWLAFYSESDYQRGIVSYSDVHDMVDIVHYEMDVDLRNPRRSMNLKSKVSMVSLQDGVRAIPFVLGEGLSDWDSQRLRKNLRLVSVKYKGTEIGGVQEDWDNTVTVFLPEPVKKDERFELEFELEGEFLRQHDRFNDCSYPRSNTSWYPRHGYLDRATYDMTFRHARRLKVATVGSRISEEDSVEDRGTVITKYQMKHPVALVTFALGPWQRHTETVTWDGTDMSIPLEFNSLGGSYTAIKESFILAELNNSVRFFNAIFGAYPYDGYSATFHPFAFGQGFPSMLMIPPADRTSKYTFAFISHETAHQWWGNIVAWRSYRDQWLSEGFAEYSGVLYTSLRQNPGAGRSLIDEMRNSIKDPPRTLTGIGRGKLNDVGPLILGFRLNTSNTLGAYQTLIYNKGALVLRMMHFLLSDPATGDDKIFYEMMKDFVEQYRNGSASTDDFRRVAGQHFARSPIGQRYGLKDLNWFFRQWVYETGFPSYRLEHTIEPGADGSVMVKGNLIQENVDENFFMPMPLVFSFGGNQTASGTIHAIGPKTPFEIRLPMRPQKVELDPHRWVLSERTR
ncbi:MAG TPA: M1 family aminopeptidase [Pyrinomonadaceae bacterium]|nr:M1 family aminopeptidase [Pyrinomonadaceae bacterium]HMP65910.1 M1 family aminopeptidase [Pyrinomonadaceae bacterium]